MNVFVTGSTGYIGSYVVNGLLRNHRDRVSVLVRAKSQEEAQQRLWRSLQLHMDFPTFEKFLRERIDIYLGDLTAPGLGLEPSARSILTRKATSIIHCAASLNRKSEKTCLNVNLRGTLAVIQLGREIQSQNGLRRFSEVSTVAVSGVRNHEVLSEDQMLDWTRSDYDPYARTKKFCEHMVSQLLPDVSHVVFRPSIVLGDSRFPETTQFDMVRAFVWLAQLRVLPFHRNWKLDIVPVDYVSRAIVQIHQKEKPKYPIYNLSSGENSLTYQQMTSILSKAACAPKKLFLPILHKPLEIMVNALSKTPRSWGISYPFSLMKVFLPYLTFDTVFRNDRVVEEMGEKPKSFDEYASGLFQFAKKGHFTYPYKPWPHLPSPDYLKKPSTLSEKDPNSPFQKTIRPSIQ